MARLLACLTPIASAALASCNNLTLPACAERRAGHCLAALTDRPAGLRVGAAGLCTSSSGRAEQVSEPLLHAIHASFTVQQVAIHCCLNAAASAVMQRANVYLPAARAHQQHTSDTPATRQRHASDTPATRQLTSSSRHTRQRHSQTLALPADASALTRPIQRRCQCSARPPAAPPRPRRCWPRARPCPCTTPARGPAFLDDTRIGHGKVAPSRQLACMRASTARLAGQPSARLQRHAAQRLAMPRRQLSHAQVEL